MRPAVILAWSVPLTFTILAVGAAFRGEALSSEAWSGITAILGGVVGAVLGRESVRVQKERPQNESR